MIVPLPIGYFEGVSLNARCVFGLLYSRRELSAANQLRGDQRFFDPYSKRVYCVYNLDELAHELGSSKRTVQRALDELREVGFVNWERNGFGASNRFYLRYEVCEDLRQRDLGKTV